MASIVKLIGRIGACIRVRVVADVVDLSVYGITSIVFILCKVKLNAMLI